MKQKNAKLETINLGNAKVIKSLNGHRSVVNLIEVDGNQYILKTADLEDIWNEKDFLQTLHNHNLPSLQVLNGSDLKDNQLLLEYITDSKGIEWENPSDVEKWGAAVRNMHSVQYDAPFKITSENKKEIIDWNTHLKQILDTAIEDQLIEQNGFTHEFLEKIRAYVYNRLNDKPINVTLIHGDLHDGNTLLKNGEVVLYDKSSELFAGDPIYDLTIMMTHFPNGLYVTTDNETNKRDVELLQAFVKGYGEDFIKTQKEKLDLYLVIRALDRYPNPFEIFNKEIIENIVNSA